MLSSSNSNRTLDTGDNNYVHSLPPFANDANKALSRNIKALEAKENILSATIDDNSLRANAILAHMKNVQSETNHTQALYDAKNRQIETEEHFKQLAERESGRISSEMNRIGSELGRISDYLNFLQTSIYRGNEKIEAVRAEFKLETDELNEWLRVQQEKEEDNLALIKYTKEDDTKEKELSLAIEKLVTQVNKSKANLTAEVTETQVAQIELENTTEAFKQLHQERQDLIHQWEEAVTTMSKRDEDIEKSQSNYRSQKVEIRKVQEKIKEKEEIFEVQLGLNSETEKNIVLAERRVAKLREEESEGIRNLQQYKDEVEVLKNTLSKSSSDLVNKRSELSNLKTNLKDKQEKLESSKKHHADLKKKMGSLDDESVSLEARAEQLQELLDKEVQRDHELDKQIKALRETQFKQSQSLFKLRQEEKNLAAEIIGGEAACRNLKSKIHKIDQEALKQRAMLYSMEFGVQQLERKIRRMEGDRTDEEKNELLAKIEALNTKYEQQLQKWNTLNNQLKRSQEDLRQSKRQLDTLSKQKTELNTSIGELNLYNESAAHQLLSKVKEKENLMVEENILRLELRRLRSFVHARSDEVLTLETRKLQLNLALDERTKEIEIHKDMLRVQLKNAEEERHSATTELRDRVGKVEKLKRRYEILMTQFAPEDGEEDHSQAFFVIKAAQKREELQREGDELDANIRKAEKEIKALENTLRLMNDRNEQYRSNLYRAEVDGNDLQHKEMLDTEYQQVIDSFKRKRTLIQDLQLQLQDSERAFSTISAKEAEKLQQVHVLEAKCDAVSRDLEEQAIKRSRALQFAHKAAKQLRKKEATTTITTIEQDFMIRAVRELGTLALQDLEKLMQTYPDIEGRIRGLMELHGLKPPSRAVSRVSSRASSVADMYSPTVSGRNSTTFERKPAYPGLLPEEAGAPVNDFNPALPKKLIEQLQPLSYNDQNAEEITGSSNSMPPLSEAEVSNKSPALTPESPIGNEVSIKLMSTTDLNASITLPKPASSSVSRSSSIAGSKKSLVTTGSISKLKSAKESPSVSRTSSRAPSRASVASEKSVASNAIAGSKSTGLILQGNEIATKSAAAPLQKRGSITGSNRIKDTARPSSAQSNSSKGAF